MKQMNYSASRWLAFLCVLLIASAVFAGNAAAQDSSQAPLPNKLLPSEQNTVNIAKRYKDSVVAINVTVKGKAVDSLQNMPPQMRQFFKQFMGQMPQAHTRTERAAGSGFVVDSKGQILTNYHVVSDALQSNSTTLADNATLNVQFSGGNKLPVKVVGVDQSFDLALLQLKDPSKLPKGAVPIPLANSNKIQVGEKAIAIGNPFTLQSTVTQGVVSAVNREQAALVSGVPIAYIQTDAAINPGNSGGPLIDSRGKLIGINDEILAPHGTFIGVGFAIPSNLISQNLSQLQSGGFIKKAMMGVEIVALAKYPKSVRQQLNLPDHGVMIVKVKPDSPAAKAGLKGAQFTVNAGEGNLPAGGDVILKADGQELTSGRTLQHIVFSKSAGDTVTLQILHNGRKRTVTVKLAVLKSSQQKAR